MGILIMKKLRDLFIVLFLFCFTSIELFAEEFIFITKKENSITYDVFIDQEVFEPAHYRDLILCLHYAEKQDIFIFHINTNGGNLFSAVEIYNAIKNTKAQTIADLYKGFSAGALITIGCQKIILNDFAIMMIHNFSQGVSGNIFDIKEELIFSKKLNDFLVEVAFGEFLDKEEIKEVLNGKNLWLSEDQLFIKFGRIKKLKTK
jgi:ATP-dependent protease ClpP protease subunit